MTVNYSSNLKLNLPVNNTEAGNWGNLTNTNLGTLLEEAIGGYITVAVTTGNTTSITIPNGTASTAPTAVARNMYIEVTGTGGTNTHLEVPTGVEKLYFIYNNTNSFISVRTPSTAAVLISQGVRTILVCNGTVVTSAINGLVDNTSNYNMLLGSTSVVTTGTNNTAVGYLALGYNQTGSENVAVGAESGYTLAGTGTVSIGRYAQYGNVNPSGNYNIAIGYAAGYDCSTGTNNIAIGHNAYQGDGATSQTGSNNVLIGYGAGQNFTTASDCVILGGYTGSLSNNSTVIADGAGNIRMYYDGSANQLDLRTAGGSRLLINSVGNIGIGTSPINMRLSIATSSTSLGLQTPSIVEPTFFTNSPATGVINFDLSSQSVMHYNGNATANWTVNFRTSSSTTLNAALPAGASITAVFMATQGATAYYNNVVQIDGTTVTPKWQGGSAPTSGNASSIDVYTYTIIKTAATPTYIVLASQTQFK